VAIIDLGAGSTKLYLVHKGVVGKTHSVLMSGVELTNAISKTAGIDFRQAEERKRQDGLFARPDDTGVQKALTTVLERGLRELHKVMARYETDEGVQVSKVVLSGSGALLNGLSPYVSEMLSRPVTIADPFAKVAYPAFLEDTLKEAGPSFAVAVGTALRGLASE
jgi:type IV pilus assembly protein PilM